ncbi:hypothetical protein HNQ02_003287 [Flavobacterium sp. 7E]|uniref:carboxypeptidase-like regulatory domain-containing protein n=1 Tax=Flavobacterium sp. 7E TaxID=2735898 RepID=UPI00156FEE42|nr:carboxypeptidase-like regulatory domain-containing protein [Flavobacterium sp. 7E]NRS90347.1 hypothetical protein [Flavobacterium sp. 7E]
MNTITKINLSKLKKCNQFWEDMTENEKGRLCLKCNHTIIDFRNLTDYEVAQIHLFSEEKVCGIYNREQVTYQKKVPIKLNLNNWSTFYSGLFSFLSFNSFGQEKIESVKTEQTEKKLYPHYDNIALESKSKTAIVSDSIFISGIVKDDINYPLPGSSVIIKGTKVGVTTDFDGFYRLNITKELDSVQKITLVYSCIGFETIERTIDSEVINEEKKWNVNMVLEAGKLTQFIIYSRQPLYKRVWNRITNIFREKK